MTRTLCKRGDNNQRWRIEKAGAGEPSLYKENKAGIAREVRSQQATVETLRCIPGTCDTEGDWRLAWALVSSLGRWELCS